MSSGKKSPKRQMYDNQLRSGQNSSEQNIANQVSPHKQNISRSAFVMASPAKQSRIRGSSRSPEQRGQGFSSGKKTLMEALA